MNRLIIHRFIIYNRLIIHRFIIIKYRFIKILNVEETVFQVGYKLYSPELNLCGNMCTSEHYLTGFTTNLCVSKFRFGIIHFSQHVMSLVIFHNFLAASLTRFLISSVITFLQLSLTHTNEQEVDDFFT